MPRVRGKGHEILTCFNNEYEASIKDIVEELMEFPESQFTLTLKRKKPMIRFSWERYVWGFVLGVGVMLIMDMMQL